MERVNEAMPICRNCGHEAGPRFCGFCGQELDAHRRPFARLVADWLSEWFALDGQLPRTLAALLRPGRLTRLYLDGRQAPYLRPFRLYAIASILLFASVLAMPEFDLSCCDVYVDGELVATATAAGPGNTSRIELFQPGAFTSALRILFPDRFVQLRQRPPQELMDAMVASLRQSLPLALVLFLPVLAAALKLLYVRTGILLIDHLVFAIHLQSVVFLLLVSIWVGSAAAGLPLVFRLLATVLGFFLTLVTYLPLALRRVYRQPWWLTALKSVLAFFIYFPVLSLSFAGSQVYFLLTM